MKAPRCAALLVAIAVGATGVAAYAAQALAANKARGPQLEVALFADGVCGKYADSLPTLMSATGVEPGDTVGDVTVCLFNDGDSDGRVTLTVTDRSDLDIGCDGQEPTYDDTCGKRRAGELGPDLLQQTGVGGCELPPPAVSAESDRRLPDLEKQALNVAPRLRPGQVVCAHLVLIYSPPDLGARILSQSDRTTWRYVFTIN